MTETRRRARHRGDRPGHRRELFWGIGAGVLLCVAAPVAVMLSDDEPRSTEPSQTTATAPVTATPSGPDTAVQTEAMPARVPAGTTVVPLTTTSAVATDVSGAPAASGAHVATASSTAALTGAASVPAASTAPSASTQPPGPAGTTASPSPGTPSPSSAPPARTPSLPAMSAAGPDVAAKPEPAAHALTRINAYRGQYGMAALRDKSSFSTCNEYYTLSRKAISRATYASDAQIDQNMDVVLWGESFNGFSWSPYQSGGSWGATMTLYQCR